MNGDNGRARETIVEYLTDEDAREAPLAFRAAGYRGEGWYYWNRRWTRCQGPYDSEPLCEAAFKKYAARTEPGG